MLNYHIGYDVSALMILTVIYVYFRAKPLRYTRHLNLFEIYFGAVVSFNMVDIATVVMGWHHTAMPMWSLYGINTLYHILCFLIPSLIAQYTIVLAGHEKKMYWFWYIPAFAGAFTALFINPFTGWIMSFAADGTYLRGPFVNVELYGLFFYIIIATIYIIVEHRYLSKVKVITVMAIGFVSFVLGLLQILMPEYLLVGMGGALSVVMVFLSFHSYDEETDLLTGLPNQQAFGLAVRRLFFHQPDMKFCIVMMDIQHLNMVNELYGWDEGNALLIRVGDKMQRSIDSDRGACARIQADRFVCCVPADEVTEESVMAFNEGLTAGADGEYPVAISFGVYPIEDTSLPVDRMCDRASLALHQVDNNYINRVAWYVPALRNSLVEEQRMAAQMENALEAGEFTVRLQPIVRLSDSRIVAAEALVRWIHPQRGEISPGAFIPLFEKNGFIVRLDRYTLETTCKLITSWQEAGRPVTPVCVNLSRINFYSANLVDEIRAIVTRYGVDPGLIHLEITESIYMEEPEKMCEGVNVLRKAGFTVLMDDFGSGYSALNALKDLPVDMLKIDLGFLRGFEKDKKGGDILKAVVLMAKSLGLPTVTEGIDAPEELQFLRDLGCDYGQGYYFSKPLSIDQYEETVQAQLPDEGACGGIVKK
jgi:diguanylate cyclase (GGDEF)-like protein